MADTNKRSMFLPIAIALIACAMTALLVSCASQGASEESPADDIEAEAEAAADEANSVQGAVENIDVATDIASDVEAEPVITLESWFKDHPEEFDQMSASFQEGFEGSFDDSIPAEASIDVEENSLLCKVHVGAELDEYQIGAAASVMDPQFDGYDATMEDLIAELESETGVEGITITLGYYDDNDTPIVEHVFGK